MSNSNKIYSLIPKAISKIGAIGKNGTNEHQRYKFRSIDDMYNQINPVLPELGLFFVPQVIETKEDFFESEKTDKYGNKITQRTIRVKQKIKYLICAEDGSFIESIVEGEALDTSDKATNKAMTAAFKYMLIQVFCIAIEEMDDADKETPEIPVKQVTKTHEKKPEQIQKPQEQKLQFAKNTDLIASGEEIKIITEKMKSLEVSTDEIKNIMLNYFNAESSKKLKSEDAKIIIDCFNNSNSKQEFFDHIIAFVAWKKENGS